MSWDLATPFIIDLRVGSEDIDGLGHGNTVDVLDYAPQAKIVAPVAV